MLGDRIVDVGDQARRGDGEERVEPHAVGVRHGEHVGLVDRLPAANRRAVEAEAVLEHALFDLAHGVGAVLPRAEDVAELEVDLLDVVFLAELEEVGGGGHGRLLRGW